MYKRAEGDALVGGAERRGATEEQMTALRGDDGKLRQWSVMVMGKCSGQAGGRGYKKR